MESTEPRRKKNPDATAHRSGTKRAAVRPHKVASATPASATASTASAPDAGTLIASYLAGLRAGSLVQSYTGPTLTKNASLIASAFGISAGTRTYLLCDPTGTGRAGLLLASSGVHVADGRGNTSALSWSDFARAQVGIQAGMLVVGRTAISTRDAKVVLGLLQHLQTKLGNMSTRTASATKSALSVPAPSPTDRLVCIF